MEPTAYDQIVAKHTSLTGIIAKIAAEDRKPTDEEKTQITTLKSDIEAIRASWESDGRNRFLAGLGAPTPTGPVVLKHDQSFADTLKGQFPDEWQRLSIGKVLRGYITGDWTGADLEMKAMGSTPTSAGGVLIPAPLSARIIDIARNTAAVLRAGAVTVPMTSSTLKLAKLTTDPTVAWYAEAGTITESDAAFTSIDFSAKKMACLVRVNNELLEDAANIDTVVENSLGQAMALELDRAALLGTGASNQPTGLNAIATTNKITSTGSPTNYDKFLQGLYACRGFNFEPNAAIYASRTGESLSKLKDTANNPLTIPADWAALTRFVSNQVPTNLGAGTNESLAFIGQWNQLMIGLRMGVQVEVTREADDVFKKDQTLIRVRWRGDIKAAQDKAFTVMSGILA